MHFFITIENLTKIEQLFKVKRRVEKQLLTQLNGRLVSKWIGWNNGQNIAEKKSEDFT